MKDEFGDRMKAYEREYTDWRIPSDQFMCVRLDGRSFSKLTKNLDKPFDYRFVEAMYATAQSLQENFNPNSIYVQSDEITLIFPPLENPNSQHIFDGKISKINSVFSGIASTAFTQKFGAVGVFDCRTWTVPDEGEASNVVLWRIHDAQRNSVSASFRWMVPEGKQRMFGKSCSQMRDILSEEVPEWKKMPDHLLSGVMWGKGYSISGSQYATLPFEDRARAMICVPTTDMFV